MLRLWVAVFSVAVLALAPATGRGAPPVARAAACDSLGAADRFAVFSDGVFTAAAGGGTSITGRVAAAGNVTLDGVSLTASTPAVVTGGDFIAGRTTGQGGSLSSGVRYAGAYDVAQNFTVNGDRTQAEPPFSFADEFQNLALVSDTWAQLAETPGTTVTLQPWGELQLVGSSTALNVFTIDAADVAAGPVQGVSVTLPSDSASALINVTTNTAITVNAQYLNVNPAGIADQLIWNLPRATSLDVTQGIAWKGLILAPHATVRGSGHPQLAGQLIAASVPGGEWVFTGTPLADCPAVTPPLDTSLSLEALCVDPFGNLDMRLRNTGDRDRDLVWDDLAGPDFGAFVARARRDEFFNVRRGGADSRIRVRADGGTTVIADGTGDRCEGEITVSKQTSGPAPPGPWTVVIEGADGAAVRSAPLAAGESVTFDTLGGYEPGTAQFGQVVGGIVYTIREPDPLGGTATISHNPVEILTGQHEYVTVTNHFPEVEPPDPDNPDPPVLPPVDPEQPTLPPGVPDPPPGPDLGGVLPGYAAADLRSGTWALRARRRRGPSSPSARGCATSATLRRSGRCCASCRSCAAGTSGAWRTSCRSASRVASAGRPGRSAARSAACGPKRGSRFAPARA